LVVHFFATKRCCQGKVQSASTDTLPDDVEGSIVVDLSIGEVASGEEGCCTDGGFDGGQEDEKDRWSHCLKFVVRGVVVKGFERWRTAAENMALVLAMLRP